MHLHDYVAPLARRPFEPGQHDCALFVAGWVLAVTGQDLAARWRGRYRTERGGQRQLKRAGFDGPVAVAASTLWEIRLIDAMPGDVCVLDGGALGILGGEHVYVLRPEGLGVLPRREMRRVFACRR